MKNLIAKSITLLLFVVAFQLHSQAQVVSGVRPPADGKMGEFTPWTKLTVSFDDNTTADIEYRIALVKRKGIGCHYQIEVKNNSTIKLTVKFKSSYYDKLVKSSFGEERKGSIKPGKILEGTLIAQGCRKEKGEEKDDYGICSACEFGVTIFVSK